MVWPLVQSPTEMYAAAKLVGQAGPGRNLLKIDPNTGVATNIGQMGQPIASLAFDGTGFYTVYRRLPETSTIVVAR